MPIFLIISSFFSFKKIMIKKNIKIIRKIIKSKIYFSIFIFSSKFITYAQKNIKIFYRLISFLFNKSVNIKKRIKNNAFKKCYTFVKKSQKKIINQVILESTFIKILLFLSYMKHAQINYFRICLKKNNYYSFFHYFQQTNTILLVGLNNYNLFFSIKLFMQFNILTFFIKIIN